MRWSDLAKIPFYLAAAAAIISCVLERWPKG
jgi:hypothetical protein